MAKRVLIFSLTYHPYIGGAEVAIKETTDRIDPSEYRFDMITLRFDSDLPKFERFGNIDIFRIGFTKKKPTPGDLRSFPLVLNKYLYPFMAFGAAIVLHRRKPYDIVMSVMTSYASFAPLFFKLTHPRIPYLVRADDGDPFEHYQKKARIVGPLFKWVFTKADRAVVTSSYLERMVRMMGYEGEVVIVPNGVNAKHFSQEYPEEELVRLKTKLKKGPDDFFLITTSRLVKKNAVDDVIRAMPALPSGVRFLVLGIGPNEEMLRSLAKELGVEDRVHFLGQIGHAEMPKYLKISDLFIRPSLSEGFGISFVEAMVAGLPVIATQEGGIADFLYDPVKNPDKSPTGYAVSPRHPEEIVEKVKLAVSDLSLRNAIISNGKTMAAERYDWGVIARKMKDLALGPLSKHTDSEH